MFRTARLLPTIILAAGIYIIDLDPVFSRSLIANRRRSTRVQLLAPTILIIVEVAIVGPLSALRLPRNPAYEEREELLWNLASLNSAPNISLSCLIAG
ncbi:hypothetical protein C8J57DRAFT_1532902 [Mycena rebaudengoi]|nr:hypothetical protein C8J57DRAFT_1532902 [Mycena rebaudengoi]